MLAVVYLRLEEYVFVEEYVGEGAVAVAFVVFGIVVVADVASPQLPRTLQSKLWAMDPFLYVCLNWGERWPENKYS